MGHVVNRIFSLKKRKSSDADTKKPVSMRKRLREIERKKSSFEVTNSLHIS